MGWSSQGRGSGPFAFSAAAGARSVTRLALVGLESAAIIGVLASSHRLSLAWGAWALALLVCLTGADRRLASRVTPRPRDLVMPVAERVGVALLVVAPVLTPSARADLLPVGLALACALSAVRAVAVTALQACGRFSRLHHRVLIVGSGQVAARLAQAVVGHPGSAMQLVGMIDDDPSFALPEVRRAGSVAELEAVVRRERVSRILLAFSPTRETEMVRRVIACEGLSADIYAVPRFFEVGIDGPVPDQISGIPLIMLPSPMRRHSTRALKRAFDVVVSLMALAGLSPVLLVVAAAVRFSGPRPFVGQRPVLFRQRRVGIGGREFMMLKFRSMVPNDDSDRTWSVVGDPRVTGLGGFLRRSGLDEAPQLWNVLRGDMSLVGPRPERPLIAEVFAGSIPEYAARHRVRPGITGWAQVNGLRGDTSIVDRARLDNYYVATWTFAADLAILVRTAMLLLRCVVPRRRTNGPRPRTPWASELRGVPIPVGAPMTPAPLSAADVAAVAQAPLVHADAT